MTGKLRLGLFLLFAVSLACVLLWGIAGLPGFGKYPGPYGDVVNASTMPDRHVPNAVTSINFDYRGLDTLGEEFILFAAVTGVCGLLRDQPDEENELRAEQLITTGRKLYPPSQAVQWMGRGMAAIVLLFGIYIVIHPQPSPGGGFQGGAIIGTASILILLATNHKIYGKVVRQNVGDWIESIGASGYILAGLGGMFAGGAFLQNLLPLGSPDSLRAGGTIPVINLCVGLEVAGGFTILFLEFFKELRRPPPEQESQQNDLEKSIPQSGS